MIADITWNGAAKTYRVQGVVFRKGRTQVISDPDLIAYLKTARGFTVIEREAAPPAPAPAETTEPAAADEPDMPWGKKGAGSEEPDAVIEDKASQPAKGPKKRYLKD